LTIAIGLVFYFKKFKTETPEELTKMKDDKSAIEMKEKA